MRDIPTENVQFLTVPRQPYAYDRNRDELVQPDADRLFPQLREDLPVKVAPAADGAKTKAGEQGLRAGPTATSRDDPDPSPSAVSRAHLRGDHRGLEHVRLGARGSGNARAGLRIEAKCPVVKGVEFVTAVALG